MLACWLCFRLSRLCRFHIKLKLGSHVVMQLDRDFVFAGVLDWAFEHDLVPIDFQPELVVTDIVMPEMEGIGAILAIKQLANPPKVIAMSAVGPGGRRNYLKWAKHLGADEVINYHKDRTEAES